MNREGELGCSADRGEEFAEGRAISGERAALHLPVGNLVNRLLGCALVLPFLPEISAHLARIEPDPGRLAAGFHLTLNAALAALFLLPLPLLARALKRVLPDRPKHGNPAAPRYLDPASLATPAVALANAAREALRMADVVEEMLEGSRELLRCDDAGIAAELRRKDNVLDRLHAALQRFLGELAQRELTGDERDRLAHILIAALNLEHAGDIIDNGLLALTAKRIRRRLRLTRPELADANAMHEHLRSLLHLAVAVFMGEDLRAARRLVEEKEDREPSRDRKGQPQGLSSRLAFGSRLLPSIRSQRPPVVGLDEIRGSAPDHFFRLLALGK